MKHDANMARRFRNSKIGDFIRWKLELKKIRKFSLNFILSVFGSREYAKFIILTRSRTGSNLLVDYLNSHRKVFVRNEIFRRLEGREYQAILSSLFGKHPFFVKAVGCKMFYDHPLDAPDCGIWKALEQDRTIRVIHLTRKNVLRSIVSHRIAEKTNLWFQKRSPIMSRVGVEDKKLNLDFNELRNEFEQTMKWQLEGEDRFKEHAILNISYEELARNPETAFATVCGFLGVPYHKPATTLKRQNPEKLMALIENFRELEDRFKGSEWQEYFAEE